MPFEIGKLDPGQVWRTTWILDSSYDSDAFLPAMQAFNVAMQEGAKPKDPPPYYDEVAAYWDTGDDSGLPRLPGSPEPTPIEYRALTAMERARIDSVTRHLMPAEEGEKRESRQFPDEMLMLAFQIAGDLPDLPDPWTASDGPQPKRARHKETGLMGLHSRIIDEVVALNGMEFIVQMGRQVLGKSRATPEESFRGRGSDVESGVRAEGSGREEAGVRLRSVPEAEAEAPEVPGSGVGGREDARRETVDAPAGSVEGETA